MKKPILFFLFILFIYQLQAQTFAVNMGGTSNDVGRGIVNDAGGNVYTIGYYQGTADFDPGPGVYNLVSNAGSIDIFLTKLDAAGNFIWAKSMGGSSSDIGYAIAIDGSGYLYITGSYQTTSDFDPGPGVTNLTSNGMNDIYVCKMNGSGNLLWAQSMGGANADVMYGITIDGMSNVYTIGIFQGTADFDPGAGTVNLTSVGLIDICLSKLDAAGNFVWAKNWGSTTNDYGYGVDVDAAGNVYTTGYFQATADFDPGPGVSNITSNGLQESFILKLNSAGNFLWAQGLGGTGNDSGYGIIVDGSGNIICNGFISNTVDFDAGAGVYNQTSNGNIDAYVYKMDAAGNFIWAKTWGGTSADFSYALALDASSNVYTTGFYQSTTDFDPGAGTYNLTSNGGNDIFVSKLYGSGNFAWALSLGGTGADWGYGITVDLAGYVQSTGYFNGVADFDPGAAVYNLTSYGGQDIYTYRFNQNVLLPLTMENFSGYNKGNFDQLMWTTANEQNIAAFDIERSIDGINFSKIASRNAEGKLTNANYEMEVATAAISSRASYYRLNIRETSGKHRYSKIIKVCALAQPVTALSASPNPFYDQLRINLEMNYDENAVLIIINSSGREIGQQKIHVTKGYNTIGIETIHSLPTGIYLLTLRTGSSNQSVRLIKQ